MQRLQLDNLPMHPNMIEWVDYLPLISMVMRELSLCNSYLLYGKTGALCKNYGAT